MYSVLQTEGNGVTTDRPCQDITPKPTQDLVHACANAIPCVVLQRRAIENYVPDAALERWANTTERREWLSAWRQLSPEQRRYLKLKQGGDGGFGRHGSPRNQGVRKLYGGLLDDEASPLWRGPPGELGPLWAEGGIRAKEIVADGGMSERNSIYHKLFAAL